MRRTGRVSAAIGRIRYPESASQKSAGADKDSLNYSVNDGILLYIKPSITGEEPRDIFNYASVQKAFPHETTADQFFTESRFESYRVLGYHALERVQTELKDEFNIQLDYFFQDSTWRQCLDALNKGVQHK